MSTEEAKKAREFAARFRDFFAWECNIVILSAALLILGLGEELWSSFLPKYLEALVIGACGRLQKVIDALCNYPGGAISDRLRPTRALVLFNLLAVAGYLICVPSPNWPVLFVGSLLVMTWSSIPEPAVFALIGLNLPSSRGTMGSGVQSIWERVPLVLVPLPGGPLIDRPGARRGGRIGLGGTILLVMTPRRSHQGQAAAAVSR